MGSLEIDVELMFKSVQANAPSVLDRAPITVAAFVVYLVTQLSSKILTDRPSAEEIIKIPSLSLNISTLKEVYRLEEFKNKTLELVVIGAGAGFLPFEKLKRP